MLAWVGVDEMRSEKDGRVPSRSSPLVSCWPDWDDVKGASSLAGRAGGKEGACKVVCARGSEMTRGARVRGREGGT